MVADIKWIRPSGTTIVTNGEDYNIKVAAELGWKPAGEDKPAKKPDPKPKAADKKEADKDSKKEADKK